MPRWMLDFYRFTLIAHVSIEDLAVFGCSKDTDPFTIEFDGFTAYQPELENRIDPRYMSVHDWIKYLKVT